MFVPFHILHSLLGLHLHLSCKKRRILFRNRVTSIYTLKFCDNGWSITRILPKTFSFFWSIVTTGLPEHIHYTAGNIRLRICRAVSNISGNVHVSICALKVIPLQAWFRENESPEFLDNLHMKLIMLSALGTEHLCTHDISPLLIPVRTIVRP